MKQERSDIAIIGMACTFPGARDLHQYWENILAKVDAVGDAPPEWEAELFYDPDADDNSRTYCRRGGFLGSLARFDPAEFGVIPQAVDGTEPDHFLALRTASEAIADAGYLNNPKYSERTSIVIGRGTYVNRGNTTAVQHSLAVDGALRILKQLHPEHTEEELSSIRRELIKSLPPFHADTAPGLVPNVITGRIANRLNLMGPNYVVDAACASSLVAVDLAIQDLRNGRCDMALAGGVHASTTPVILIIFSQLKALSRAGQIRPFAAEADGTLLAEGVGLVVLKRFEDAEKDGDRIYAVIKGVGVASDGRALGLLAPRLEGEQLALRRAYEDARVDPASIGLVEAHGTATLVGDAVEVEALKTVLGGRRGELPRCALGSVKSMIGHTMPAAGIAGLIKTALALHHKVLPPTLHCENPNRKLGLEESNFYLNGEPRPWIQENAGSARRAGVNAFGFGGINAHAVLEEYTGPRTAPALQHRWDSELFVLSAPDPGSLRLELERVRRLVGEAGDDLPLKNLAWTLNCQRPREAERLCVVASSRNDLAAKLEKAAAKLADGRVRSLRNKEGIYYFSEPLAREGKVALMFPGEGAQYTGMLADLAIHFPEVRGWFDLMDGAFANHSRGYRPSDAVFPPPGASSNRLNAMDVGAEAAFTGNQALFALLEKLKLRPHAMVGHSTGEHSALLAARVVGATTREELTAYVLGVNRVFENLSGAGEVREGVLLAVAGAAPEVLTTLVGSRSDLYIALDNCPHQVVLCGSEEAVSFVLEQLRKTAAVCQRLPMGRAYHTPLFDNFAARLRSFLETLPVQAPSLDLYSCVTASRYPSEPEAIRTLAARQWASAVRFRDTIETMHRDGIRVFIESGPRGNLSSFLDDILRGKPYAAIPANVAYRSGISQLNHMCAILLAHGVELDLSILYERRAPALYPPSQPARPNRAMPIATGLQPFRLPAGFKLPASASTRAPEKAVAPAPPPPSPPPPSGPGPSSVMQQYFANMTAFLAAEKQTMAAYLAARTAAPSPAPARPVTRPFAQQVVELIPGRRAVIRHTFSLEREPMFRHHTLGRTVSETDHALSGIPVVPLTVTMEILAEAASVLMPNQVLCGMREVRSSRWLTLERELTIEMTAEAGDEPGSVRVRLRPADGPPLAVWAEGVMLFAPAYSQGPTPAPENLRNARTSSWTPERLYLEGMFHGPSFMAVKSMERCGDDGCLATLTTPAKTQLIAGGPAPAFLVDPVILDATGQAVAFWSQERLQPQGDIFPFRLEKLECFLPPPQSPGAEFQCHVRVTSASESALASDIDVVDSAGRLHYRLTGWHDRRFLLPRSLWDLRLSSGRTLVGKPWNEPLPEHAGAAGLACCLVDDLSSALLESSHGLWAEMLAHLILSRRERDQWERLRGAISKRRFEWLRGRCAGKDAVRQLVLERTGTALRAADVELIPDQWGRPRVEGHWTASLAIEPVVSISHSAESAVALAASSQEAMIGIDLESRTRGHGNFAGVAFEEAERRVIDDVQPGNRDEWYLRMWCAKEAVAKALGRGFEHGLRSLAVVRIEKESGIVHVELRNGLVTEFPLLCGGPVVANTSSGRDYVCSTVINQGSTHR